MFQASAQILTLFGKLIIIQSNEYSNEITQDVLKSQKKYLQVYEILIFDLTALILGNGYIGQPTQNLFYLLIYFRIRVRFKS